MHRQVLHIKLIMHSFHRQKALIVITGPTASGKTDVAINVAKYFNTEILSADSRQMYKEIPISTAAPDSTQLKEVKHHFIHNLSITDYYSVALYEQQAMAKAEELFKTQNYVVVCGGSMMYIDALCKGIDEMPTVPDKIRMELGKEWKNNGDEWLLEQLAILDPDYYSLVDLNNLKRVFHAVEISKAAKRPYSSLLSGKHCVRPFDIIKFALTSPREILFNRINTRVNKMIEAGLETEARSVYPQRNLNSLNTVGLKEMFAYIDGTFDFQTAIARIQKNTRVYAKKQLTWHQRDLEIKWIDTTATKNPADIIINACS